MYYKHTNSSSGQKSTRTFQIMKNVQDVIIQMGSSTRCPGQSKHTLPQNIDHHEYMNTTPCALTRDGEGGGGGDHALFVPRRAHVHPAVPHPRVLHHQVPPSLLHPVPVHEYGLPGPAPRVHGHGVAASRARKLGRRALLHVK